MAVTEGVSLQSLEPVSHDLVGEQPDASVVLAAPLVPTSSRAAIEPSGEVARSTPPAPRTASEWLAIFETHSDVELRAEAATTFEAGIESPRQIGLLRALEGRGPEVSGEAFLRASRLPEVAHRGLSVPAFAVARLAARAEDPGVGQTLARVAFGPLPGASSRLRGQAVAALVQSTPPDRYAWLHDQLWRTIDSSVLASALGAARALSPELQLTLADLAGPTRSPFPHSDPAR
jgi:hypothetical protein